MNFKNSEFLMLLVAFLVGYFFQEIMNGGDIIEGNNKCTCAGGIAATKYCPHDNLEYCVSCTDGSKPREDTTKKHNKKLNINDSEFYCSNWRSIPNVKSCTTVEGKTFKPSGPVYENIFKPALFGEAKVTVVSSDIGNEQAHGG